MIRNVVVHLLNDQPLTADLFELPGAADYAVICTNIRGIDGKRPTFVLRADGIFLFPLTQVRFIELPPAAAESVSGEARLQRPSGSDEATGGSDDRAAGAAPGPASPAPPGGAARPPSWGDLAGMPATMRDEDSEFLDNALLRRIREI